MSIKDGMDFDEYLKNVNYQLPKARPDGVVYELYKAGICILDAVNILEEQTKQKKEDGEND